MGASSDGITLLEATSFDDIQPTLHLVPVSLLFTGYHSLSISLRTS
jgi:hypothetical protein